MREHDLYVGVGLSGQDYGASRRCPSSEVAGIVGLWADLDLSQTHIQRRRCRQPSRMQSGFCQNSSRPPSWFGPATVLMLGGSLENCSSLSQTRSAKPRRISRYAGSRSSA
jgi:hypothetical protein